MNGELHTPLDSVRTPVSPIALPPGVRFVETHVSALGKKSMLKSPRSAIHSGKLGDIIYALPTCRALGATHLILNCVNPKDDPLRVFPVEAARQLVPLLLAQSYIHRVTISASDFPLETLGLHPDPVDYNFDCYRTVPRHRIGRVFAETAPKFVKVFENDLPAHLGEHFAAIFGLQPDLEEDWLLAEPEQKTDVVISITQNWRTYPDWYWATLLDGLSSVQFVGHEKEWEAAKIPGSTFSPSRDHLALANTIAGAKVFLGTVSFPYSVAEALKMPRAVEMCQRNLNAFPVGDSGFALPPNVLDARRWLALQLGLERSHPYIAKTRKLSLHWGLWFRTKALQFQMFIASANHPAGSTAKLVLRGKRRVNFS